MKILSSFTHPLVVANLNEFLSSAEHKGRYFEERVEPNSCLAPLTYLVENYVEIRSRKKVEILWMSMVPKFQWFFKIPSFVFSRRKKLIQVCNNLRVSK